MKNINKATIIGYEPADFAKYLLRNAPAEKIKADKVYRLLEEVNERLMALDATPRELDGGLRIVVDPKAGRDEKKTHTKIEFYSRLDGSWQVFRVFKGIAGSEAVHYTVLNRNLKKKIALLMMEEEEERMLLERWYK